MFNVKAVVANISFAKAMQLLDTIRSSFGLRIHEIKMSWRPAANVLITKRTSLAYGEVRYTLSFNRSFSWNDNRTQALAKLTETVSSLVVENGNTIIVTMSLSKSVERFCLGICQIFGWGLSDVMDVSDMLHRFQRMSVVKSDVSARDLSNPRPGTVQRRQGDIQSAG